MVRVYNIFMFLLEIDFFLSMMFLLYQRNTGITEFCLFQTARITLHSVPPDLLPLCCLKCEFIARLLV